jgi:hypothetical protein
MKGYLLPKSWLERVILLSFILMCVISTIDAMVGHEIGHSSDQLKLAKNKAVQQEQALMALKIKTPTIP